MSHPSPSSHANPFSEEPSALPLSRLNALFDDILELAGPGNLDYQSTQVVENVAGSLNLWIEERDRLVASASTSAGIGDNVRLPRDSFSQLAWLVRLVLES
jgi:hypothetical protein